MELARVVVEAPGAQRATVRGGHAAELAQAERATVEFEALHHQVVVVLLKPTVGRCPLGIAARAEDARAEAVFVGAAQRRTRGSCFLAAGLAVAGRDCVWRCRQFIEGAHELLESSRRAVEVAAELVWVQHPREGEVCLALLRQGRRSVDWRAEEGKDARGVTCELENLLCHADGERNGVVLLHAGRFCGGPAATAVGAATCTTTPVATTTTLLAQCID